MITCRGSPKPRRASTACPTNTREQRPRKGHDLTRFSGDTGRAREGTKALEGRATERERPAGLAHGGQKRRRETWAGKHRFGVSGAARPANLRSCRRSVSREEPVTPLVSTGALSVRLCPCHLPSPLYLELELSFGGLDSSPQNSSQTPPHTHTPQRERQTPTVAGQALRDLEPSLCRERISRFPLSVPRTFFQALLKSHHLKKAYSKKFLKSFIL